MSSFVPKIVSRIFHRIVPRTVPRIVFPSNLLFELVSDNSILKAHPWDCFKGPFYNLLTLNIQLIQNNITYQSQRYLAFGNVFSSALL